LVLLVSQGSIRADRSRLGRGFDGLARRSFFGRGRSSPPATVVVVVVLTIPVAGGQGKECSGGEAGKS
jgi:hypothetical protein